MLQRKFQALGVPVELRYPGAPHAEHADVQGFLIHVLTGRHGSDAEQLPLRRKQVGRSKGGSHVLQAFKATSEQPRDVGFAYVRATDNGVSLALVCH